MKKVKSLIKGDGAYGHKPNCQCGTCLAIRHGRKIGKQISQVRQSWQDLLSRQAAEPAGQAGKPAEPAGQKLENESAPPQPDQVKSAGEQSGKQAESSIQPAEQPAPPAEPSSAELLQRLQNETAPAGGAAASQPGAQPGPADLAGAPPRPDQPVQPNPNQVLNDLGMTPAQFDEALNYAAKDLINGPYIAFSFILSLKGQELKDFALTPAEEKEFVNRLVSICKRYGWTWILRVQYLDILMFVVSYTGTLYSRVKTVGINRNKEVGGEDEDDAETDDDDGDVAGKTADPDAPVG